MHYAALESGRKFFNTYCVPQAHGLKVVELGSQNINGSLRDAISSNVAEYVGLDFSPGNGVDVILKDAYSLPFNDNTFDIMVTSSCFEHSEMFWLSFLEGIRILKPNGIMYCNAPSSWMDYHRYPVDCWRFYPDAGKGLETWAKRNNYNTMVLESYITPPANHYESYSDWVCVFLKDANYVNEYPTRMIDTIMPFSGSPIAVNQYFNGFRFPANATYPSGWDRPLSNHPQGKSL